MKRKKKKNNRLTKPIASQVKIELWSELKVQAIREGRKTGEVLDDAIRMYLESRKNDFLGLGFLPFE
ncbi:MAG: hypothetical protein PVH36_14415 [Desulfobacterales bacterium]